MPETEMASEAGRDPRPPGTAAEQGAVEDRSADGQRAEVSNLEIVRHYFDLAADRLKPRRRPAGRLLDALSRGHGPDPGQALRRQGPRLLRLPDPAQRSPRPVQGRRPLPPRGRHRRGPRARLADDLEDRGRRRPVRRRQGRRQLPRRRARALRAAGDHALVHGQDREGARPDPRHPRARRQHQRPDDGLDDGRVREAPRPHARDLHRQADRARGLATAARRRPAAAASTCSARPPPTSASAPPTPRSSSRASATSARGRRGSCSSSARKMVGVSDASGAIRNDERHRRERAPRPHRRGRRRSPSSSGAERSTRDDLVAIPCDVFIPAALGGMIHEGNADRMQCRMLVEGANSPTTPAADQILREKGTYVIPDVMANAGGVVVSYFEWVQNLQHFRWEEREVNDKLGTIMRRAYREVSARAKEEGSTCARPPTSSGSSAWSRPRGPAATSTPTASPARRRLEVEVLRLALLEPELVVLGRVAEELRRVLEDVIVLVLGSSSSARRRSRTPLRQLGSRSACSSPVLVLGRSSECSSSGSGATSTRPRAGSGSIASNGAGCSTVSSDSTGRSLGGPRATSGSAATVGACRALARSRSSRSIELVGSSSSVCRAGRPRPAPRRRLGSLGGRGACSAPSASALGSRGSSMRRLAAVGARRASVPFPECSAASSVSGKSGSPGRLGGPKASSSRRCSSASVGAVLALQVQVLANRVVEDSHGDQAEKSTAPIRARRHGFLHGASPPGRRSARRRRTSFAAGAPSLRAQARPAGPCLGAPLTRFLPARFAS